MGQGTIAHLTGSNRRAGSSAPLEIIWIDTNGTPVTPASGGTASTDESAFTVGSGSGTPMMGIFETSPSTLSNGQVGLVGLTTDRKLKVSGSFSSTPITAATPTLSNVASSASSVTLLASNASRLSFRIYNDSTAVVFAKCGATASSSSYTEQIAPGKSWGTLELGVNYTGIIDGIWASANGNARVTELAA